MSAIESLLERLETGWLPKRDRIDRDVRQVDLYGWQVLENPREVGIIPNYIAGFDQHDSKVIATGPLLRWGPNMDGR